MLHVRQRLFTHALSSFALVGLTHHSQSTAGSKRCEILRPHLDEIARSDDWGTRLLHAASDISDQRGYTSYIEKYGVLKLPTLVIFRRGHPTMYPYDRPLTQEDVTAWLDSVTQAEMLPRGADDAAEAVRPVRR